MKHRGPAWLPPIFVAILVFALSAEAAEQGGPRPGDLVRITVYGQPDLTTLARVSADNMISFPFIGQVQVGEVSIATAQNNVARALQRKGIVRNPQVNVFVETQSTLGGDFVTILGEVNDPGRYSLGNESLLATRTLLDLLAVAGGATETANSRIILFRKGEDGTGGDRREIDMDDLLTGGTLQETNVELVGGDVVIVPEADAFYIYGQVNRPGRYLMRKDMMVMHAISIGGGVTKRGNEKGIVLTRLAGGQRQQLIDAKLEDGILPEDVIYVKERFF
jgi:polysaccharide export outer membrane protein